MLLTIISPLQGLFFEITIISINIFGALPLKYAGEQQDIYREEIARMS
jgi:hypothetical protein